MSNLLLNPWSSLDSIFNDFNRAFSYRNESTFPSVQTHRDENEIELRFELPGVDPNKVELNYENETLTIKGVRDFATKKEVHDFIRKERFSGSFERSFILPWKVDEEKIQASYKKGLLVVELKKEKAQKPKKITIQTKGVA